MSSIIKSESINSTTNKCTKKQKCFKMLETVTSRFLKITHILRVGLKLKTYMQIVNLT